MTDRLLAGLAVALNTGQATQTDGTGAFTFDLVQNDIRVNHLTLDGPSIVSRGITLAAPSTRDINVDAIEAQAPFDLGFYRFLVRNGFESPTLEPLRRWVQSPMIYIRTVDDSEASIPNASLNLVASVLTDTLPRWTNQRFSVAGIETGTETREGKSGWLTVRWAVTDARCGSAVVGRDGGYIELRSPRGTLCNCNGAIRARTVRHELGHALGFWHTGDASDLMSGLSVAGCDQLPSARELYHANIAYSRPFGNVDPDADPPAATTLVAKAFRAKVIVD
ncbi:MAG TPA: hypothetical protein VKB50_14460 [Vicinamibacterales bacterium]|nr:hypothetical protein [Vicinamibacterales bacterium]